MKPEREGLEAEALDAHGAGTREGATLEEDEQTLVLDFQTQVFERAVALSQIRFAL